jgi:carbonic anhydrase
MEQSPIDILVPASENLPDIQFDYAPSALTILNNGHTVQVNYDEGSGISIDGHEYALLQFHFHHPSEHTIAGVTYPLEMHLVHADADGNLAVVGLLIQEGTDANAGLESVFANLPTEHADAHAVEGASVNAADVLPAESLYYTYPGSLTTPPCSEGVRWLVLTTSITLSVEQIETFSSVFELDARPVQPLNSRDVVMDSAADG